MDTVGVILDHYDEFSSHAGGAEKEHDERRQRLLGILLRGYAHYDRGLSREAFRCIGKYIFIGPHMEEKQRERLFTHGARKLLCLLMEDEGERRRFDAWLLSLALPHVKEIHEAVSSVVEKKLSQYNGSAMARLAEEAASEEVAAIRMNGSLFGALLGLAFFAAGVMI